MASELDMLLASVPPCDAADFAAFEAAFLGRKPGCLATADLIRLALGQADPEAARSGQTHLATCDSCRAIHTAYKEGLEEEDAPAAGGSLLEEFGNREERMSPVHPMRTPAPPSPNLPAASGSQSLSLTNVGAMLLSGRWEEALELLQPCLPEFLDAVGLDPARSNDFFQFIRQRLTSGQGLPSSGLPGWLEDFARTELGLRALPRRLTAAEWEASRHRGALLYLRESPEEPPAAREFLDLALRQGVRSCEQLELIRLKNRSPRVSISDLECRHLIKRGRKHSKQLVPVFPTMSN